MLYGTSIATTKISAINALCHYFVKETKQDYEYFIIFDGKKARIYHTWGNLQKAVGKRNTSQGWRGFYTQHATEKAFRQYIESEGSKILQPPRSNIIQERSGQNFHKFSILMNMKLSFRQQWLSNLPTEVQLIISNKIKQDLYFDLSVLQELIGDLNESSTLGLEVDKYSGLSLQKNYAPPHHHPNTTCQNRLGAICHQGNGRGIIFFNGMLLLLSIPNEEEVPSFFGSKLQNLISSFARGHGFEAHIISELTRYNGKEWCSYQK